MSKKCIDCKHLNKELAFCRACGAKWLKETDGENCKYFEKITSPTLFDRIKKSPEVLAEAITYPYDIRIAGGGENDWKEYWTSPLAPKYYPTKSEALDATVAKLEEVAE